MNLDQLRSISTDYQPGHTEPADLRVAMGHDLGTRFTPPCNLLRIHGTGLQTLALLQVLMHHSFADLQMIDVDMCSEVVPGQLPCTHSYWRAR